MPAENIRQVADNLAAHSQAQMATLCAAITDADELGNPNVVKLVRDLAGYALYFSRACIPWREHSEHLLDELKDTGWFRHIGLYAYRCSFLKSYSTLPYAPLEARERLEQLRALSNGTRIHAAVAQMPTFAGVDTPEDLARVRRLLDAH